MEHIVLVVVQETNYARLHLVLGTPKIFSVGFKLFRRTGDMSRNAGSGENGDFGEISPRLLTK